VAVAEQTGQRQPEEGRSRPQSTRPRQPQATTKAEQSKIHSCLQANNATCMGRGARNLGSKIIVNQRNIEKVGHETF